MDEQKHDKIMREAERIYNRQFKLGDPYSFHKAFEYAKKWVASPVDNIVSKGGRELGG